MTAMIPRHMTPEQQKLWACLITFWTPVERGYPTAMRDVLAWNGDSILQLYWAAGVWRVAYDGARISGAAPTHWMPLPPPPPD